MNIDRATAALSRMRYAHAKRASGAVQPDGSARREALVAAVKRDIENVAHIYPTAFSLYDEPLDRLARRVVATTEAQNRELSRG